MPDHDSTGVSGVLDQASKFGGVAAVISALTVLWRGAKWFLAIGQMQSDFAAFKTEMQASLAALRSAYDENHAEATAWRAEAMERIVRTESIVDSRRSRRDPA